MTHHFCQVPLLNSPLHEWTYTDTMPQSPEHKVKMSTAKLRVILRASTTPLREGLGRSKSAHRPPKIAAGSLRWTSRNLAQLNKLPTRHSVCALYKHPCHSHNLHRLLDIRSEYPGILAILSTFLVQSPTTCKHGHCPLSKAQKVENCGIRRSSFHLEAKNRPVECFAPRPSIC